MQGQMSDIEWEIQQLWMAVDYYERAIENAHFTVEVEKFRKTIASLNKQIKDLERKRDEYGE
jgi:phage host-nuclease inhibitor protein Gam